MSQELSRQDGLLPSGEAGAPAGRRLLAQRLLRLAGDVADNRKLILDAAMRRARGGRSFVATAFLFGVLAPTLIYLCYAVLWQSRGYVSETRITVRAAQAQRAIGSDVASSFIGKLIASAGLKTSPQDGWIVANYLRSTAILNDLGGVKTLSDYYSASFLDYFSRLDPESSIEDALKYWEKRVYVSMDTVAGIITVRVEAFTPEQARKLAQDIVRRSEDLVNHVSLRSRQDDVERSAREVTSSGEKLAVAREALTQFRNESALIDPTQRVKTITELLSKLTLEKIELESNVSLLSGSLSPSAASLRMSTARLAEVNQQIDKLKHDLTSASNSGAVSGQIAQYERLKLEEQFAAKLYGIAVSGYERARQELDRKQMYLITAVQPTMPEEATSPRIAVNASLLFLSLTIAWGIISLFNASIQEQRI